jgi:glyoxylase-like metal-dependent hydrolase (beta-lactamase superfamily II)
MLSILPLTLGIVQTNTYLVADPASGEAVVIDPADEGARIVREAQKRGWRINAMWLTHAHFDHIAGAADVFAHLEPPPTIALHRSDLPLLQMQGGAPYFGLQIADPPEPTLSLQHGQMLQVGSYNFEVRHCPGHSPGHVIFYCAAENVLFCGDVIFAGSIGRTDLPGGDFDTLIRSIRTHILTLPDETRLYAGHGEKTTVGEERRENPYVSSREFRIP